MKKLIRTIADKFNHASRAIAASVQSTATVAMNDIEGSDTTEKIGMVVVAVLIVGLLATAMKTFMPNLFNNVGNKATSVMNDILGAQSWG